MRGDSFANLSLRRDPIGAAFSHAAESVRKAMLARTPRISEPELNELFIDQSVMASASLRIRGKIREINLPRSKSNAA